MRYLLVSHHAPFECIVTLVARILRRSAEKKKPLIIVLQKCLVNCTTNGIEVVLALRLQTPVRSGNRAQDRRCLNFHEYQLCLIQILLRGLHTTSCLSCTVVAFPMYTLVKHIGDIMYSSLLCRA